MGLSSFRKDNLICIIIVYNELTVINVFIFVGSYVFLLVSSELNILEFSLTHVFA